MKLIAKEVDGNSIIEYQGISIVISPDTKLVYSIHAEEGAKITTIQNMLNDIKYGRVEGLDDDLEMGSDEQEFIDAMTNKLR